MKQSRLTSLLKSSVSTAVGFGVAFVANMLILPWFGLPISHADNLLLTTIYTVISIARGYLLERLYEALGWRTRLSAFAMAVLAERQRQQDVEGWSLSHDDEHAEGELARAGAAYAVFTAGRVEGALVRSIWPWSLDWWKPAGFRRDLVKAAALIIAEGEKHDRNRKRRKPADEAVASRRADMVDCVQESNPRLTRSEAERIYDDALRGMPAER